MQRRSGHERLSVGAVREALLRFGLGDLSVALRQPDPDAPDLIAGWFMRGKSDVGMFERRIIERHGERPYVIHASLDLSVGLQGQGLGTAFLEYSEEAYRAEGLAHVEMTASKVGSYAWANRGFDFDLRRYLVPGDATETQQRAYAVRETLEYPGREIRRTADGTGRTIIEREPGPEDVLHEVERRDDSLVARFRSQVPSEADIANETLEGKFAAPADLALFDSDGDARLGRRIMLSTGWYGIKRL